MRFFARIAHPGRLEEAASDHTAPAEEAEILVPEPRDGGNAEDEGEGGRETTAVVDGPVSDEPLSEEPLSEEPPSDKPPSDEPPSEEPEPQILITAVAPAEVTPDLARRLAALDRSEMVASSRNLALVDARALLGKLQALSGGLWVTGPLTRPTGWVTLTTPAEGAVLHGTVGTGHRRKGIGSRLMEEALAYALEHDYRTITGTVWTDSPSETFVRRYGFEPRPHASAIRVQDLSATTERRRRIAEDTAGYGASYELVTSEEELEQGGSLFRVVASHRVTGATVGSAELTVADGAPEFAVNGTVEVDPRHRGTRLGTLMSIELIAFMQSKATRVRLVQVTSPASDPYITTILDRVGFRVAGVQAEHRLRLR